MLCVIMVIEGWGRHYVCVSGSRVQSATKQRARATLGSTVSHSVLASQPTPAHASARGTYNIIARVMKAWWHKPPFPRWHATRGGCLRHRVFTARAVMDAPVQSTPPLETHTVPTPSLNYHDHTQHASFNCWLLDALVKSPLA